MGRRPSTVPTEAQLEILRIIWKNGVCTVREVVDEMQNLRETGYTTVLKLMQIMTDKGILERDETNRSHVYRAAVTQRSTQRKMLNDLLVRVFGGSAHKLLVELISSREVSSEELDDIRQLLDEAAGPNRDDQDKIADRD